jgi:hypothetical protein
MLAGGILIWLLCCRKSRRAKVEKHVAPKSVPKASPAEPVSERKDDLKGPLKKDSPPKTPLQTKVSDSKKGDPPAPSTPPGVTPAPAVVTHTPQLASENNPALNRALSESHGGKTNVVPYSEYRKKRLENIRKESGLEDGALRSCSRSILVLVGGRRA